MPIREYGTYTERIEEQNVLVGNITLNVLLPNHLYCVSVRFS